MHLTRFSLDSVGKAGLIGLVRMRYVWSNDALQMRPDLLTDAIEEDKVNGLIQFFMCATLGTNSACTFDYTFDYL